MQADHAHHTLPNLRARWTGAAGRQLIAWLANVLLIGGVILVSVFPPVAIDAPVFFLFLTGHLGLIVHTRRNRDMPMLVLNTFLAALDVYAIVVRL